MSSKQACLWLAVGGSMILFIGMGAPFLADDLKRDPDMITAGYVALGIATVLYFSTRSRRNTSK